MHTPQLFTILKSYDIFKIVRKQGRPTFSQLSTHQLLNYVKFNLGKLSDAFRMYAEIKTIPEREKIITSLFHKIAVSVSKDQKPFLIKHPEFLIIYREVGKFAPLQENKPLIDTIYSLSLIYSETGEKKKISKSLWHFLSSYLTEVIDRLPMLNENHISFLCRGLNKLNRIFVDIPKIKELNEGLGELIGSLVPKLTSYSLPPIMQYLIENSEIINKHIGLYPALLGHLISDILPQEMYIREADLALCAKYASKFSGDPIIVRKALDALQTPIFNQAKQLEYFHVQTILQAYTKRNFMPPKMFEAIYNCACDHYMLQTKQYGIVEISSVISCMSQFFLRPVYSHLPSVYFSIVTPYNNQFNFNVYQTRLKYFLV